MTTTLDKSRIQPAGAAGAGGLRAGDAPRPAVVYPIEGVAAAPVASSLGTLVTRHILRDGEVILLILKPSLWFIVFNSLRFATAVAILMIGAKVFDQRLHLKPAVYLEAGIFLLAGRVMWAVLQWMGRLYILTDLRILRLSGIFNVDIFDCPLRKVRRTRLVYTIKERLLGLGTIEIIPRDENQPLGFWQTIRRPAQVHEQIVATINRAKHCGLGGENGGS